MRINFFQQNSRMLTLLIGLASLSACGGGSDFDPAQQKSTKLLASVTSSSGDRTAQSDAAGGALSATLLASTEITPAASTTAAVTDVRFESTGSAAQAGVPVTFGQVFAVGALPAAATLIGKLPDGAMVPLQVDVKARHPDGSARHAVISAVLPSLNPGQTVAMTLLKTAPYASNIAATPMTVLSSGFSAAASITLLGRQYTASAEALLKGGKVTNWLVGPIVNEWHVFAPLTGADGAAHPHLSARFAIRSYAGSKKTRVDVTIENNWAYEAAPQNFVYDARITVGGQPVFSKAALTHYHHARWRKVFWWGGEPQVHIKHNTAYLVASKALPNYDRSVVISEATLAGMESGWTGAKTEPMGVGEANPYMPSTGGRADIGLLPGWAATYLLSMDKRAKKVTLGTADLAGSWSSHYRNKLTDRPVSLADFPYMTILAGRGDTLNPVTKQYEQFPACPATVCTTPNKHDSSHQPAFAYLPYLVTGDYYYLEELQFWAMWNTFSDNPGYRENVKGLLKPDQVRGQAWSLRTLAEAAYITPDADPLKVQFEYFLSNNLDWYNANYTNNSAANGLGILTHGYAIVYNSNTGVAPWMDDFFTSAVGHAYELGYAKAKPLLVWKSKFPISRMTGEGACWIDGAIYSLKVRDSATGPIYSSIGQAYKASHSTEFNALVCGGTDMAVALKLRVGEMTGYSGSNVGYPSNMQPALAYSADVGGLGGANAWGVFMARSVKPNYHHSPQFAIVPR